MTSESIVGLLTLIVQQHISRTNPSSEAEEEEEEGDEPPERLTPNSWAIGGLIFATATSVGILAILFGQQHLQPWVPLVGVGLAGVLSILAVRALGATDLNPVNALGKLSQLAFALLQPGSILANMVSFLVCVSFFCICDSSHFIDVSASFLYRLGVRFRKLVQCRLAS